MKINLHSVSVCVLMGLLGLGFSACNDGGEGAKLFKAFNQDKNNYLEDREFYEAVANMDYFETWNQNGDGALSQEEWRAGTTEYLGGYKIHQVEKFGEWDLNGDNQVSEDEFRESLFEVVDKDGNMQVTEKEFVDLYKEGSSSKK